MSLRDKAAKVNFDDLDDEPSKGRPDVGAQAAPAVALEAAGALPAQRPGRMTGVGALTERISLHHQVVELQAQVAKFEESQLVLKLDPRRVRQSKWKNRHELAYQTPQYQELKAEIEAAGGNVQPIKVRRAGKGGDGQDEYEIVYGRRRLRACRELELDVAAIIEEMDDLQLFTEMERENRSRADLSPWEQGVMYKDALDAKLFSSQRQMAAALNVSQTNLSMAVALASLPDEVIAAFPTPLDLQYRWAADLTNALERDTARVITLARELAQAKQRLPAKEVLACLVAAGSPGKLEAIQKDVKVGEKIVGSLTRDGKGAVTLKLKPGMLNQAGEKKLLEFVEAACASALDAIRK